MTESFIKKAEVELAKQDPILGNLIKKQKLKPLTVRNDYFSSLCRSIVGQQVSVAAANAIYSRLEAMTKMSPKKVYDLSQEDIKSIGLSKYKAAYIADLAQHFITDPNIYNHLEKQDDKQVVEELTAIKGIGVWTAQMFLIFTLARPDVFAPADVGLMRGLIRLYGLDSPPSLAEVEKITLAWKPYRTVASLHLWHSLNNTPS